MAGRLKLPCGWRLIAVSLFLSAVSEAQGAETTLHKDFGVQDSGQILTATFEVPNDTGVDIRIVRSHVSCGCLAVKRLPDKIRAGSSETIEVALDLRDRYGISGGTVLIVTDSESLKKPIALVIKAVTSSVWTDPKTIKFRAFRSESDLAQIVRVYGSGNWAADGSKIISAQIAPDFRCSRVESDKDDNGDLPRGVQLLGQFRVASPSELRTKNSCDAQLRIVIDNGKQTSVSVPVRYTTLSEVVSEPRRVLFSGSGDHEVREVIIRKADRSIPLDLKTIVLESDHDFVVAEIVVNDDKEDDAIRVRVTCDRKASGVKGIVCGQISGKAQGQQAFELPYVITASD